MSFTKFHALVSEKTGKNKTPTSYFINRGCENERMKERKKKENDVLH
jgi:hypothetical protein